MLEKAVLAIDDAVAIGPFVVARGVKEWDGDGIKLVGLDNVEKSVVALVGTGLDVAEIDGGKQFSLRIGYPSPKRGVRLICSMPYGDSAVLGGEKSVSVCATSWDRREG